MNTNNLKLTIIIALALIAAVFLYRYMSPYESCVRDFGGSQHSATTFCARFVKSS